MVAVSALVFVLLCITSVHVRFSRIDPTNKRVLRARARPQHSHSSNWTASIVTGTIFRPDWPVALCVRAHVLPAGCKRKGENTHTHTRGGDNGFRRVWEERIHRYYAAPRSGRDTGCNVELFAMPGLGTLLGEDML